MSDDVSVDQGIPAEGDEQRFVTLGRISGAHGIQGWVRVHSDTSPRENILNYSPWHLVRQGRRESRKVLAGRRQGKSVVAKLAACSDRNAAEDLVGTPVDAAR